MERKTKGPNSLSDIRIPLLSENTNENEKPCRFNDLNALTECERKPLTTDKLRTTKWATFKNIQNLVLFLDVTSFLFLSDLQLQLKFKLKQDHVNSA